jgi:hypothetical protein
MSIDTLERSPAPQAGLTSPTATLLQRVQSEYHEMPGLMLTEAQAKRLWGMDAAMCRAVLATLLERGFLRRTMIGAYVRASD